MVFYRWAGAAAVLLLAIISGVLVIPDKMGNLNQAEGRKTQLPAQTIQQDTPTPETAIPINVADSPGRKTATEKGSRLKERQQVDLPVQEKVRESWRPVLTAENGQHGRGDLTLPEQKEITLVMIPGQKLMVAMATPPDHHKEQGKVWKPVVSKEKKEMEWELGLRLTPAYASQSTGYSAAYASNLSNTASSGQTGVGGGISVGMKASKRWRVESGLYYSRSDVSQRRTSSFASSNADYFAMASADKNFYSNRITMENGMLALNTPAGKIHIDQVPQQSKLVSGAETAIGMNTILLTPDDFLQVFDFLELPLTARYQILDGKMVLELQSGLSANFVVGNQVFVGEGSDRQYLGRTSNIAPLGFSGMAGLGFSYPLSKKIAITLEPRASYWFSSMNNSGEVTFKPWKIGVVSGLTFGF